MKTYFDILPDHLAHRIVFKACMLELKERTRSFEADDPDCLYKSIVVLCDVRSKRLGSDGRDAFVKHFKYFFHIDFEDLKWFQRSYNQASQDSFAWEKVLYDVADRLERYHDRMLYIDGYIPVSPDVTETLWTGFDDNTGDDYDFDLSGFPSIFGRDRAPFSQDAWNTYLINCLTD